TRKNAPLVNAVRPSPGTDGCFPAPEGRRVPQCPLAGQLTARPTNACGQMPHRLSGDGQRPAAARGGSALPGGGLGAGKEIVPLRGHIGRVLSLALCGDGKRLVSGGRDQTIKLWDLKAGK